jgi:hypothetical protein
MRGSTLLHLYAFMTWIWELFYQGANMPLVVVMEGQPAQWFQTVADGRLLDSGCPSVTMICISSFNELSLLHPISLVNIFIFVLAVLIVSVFFCSVYRSCSCLQVGSWTTHVNLTVRCKSGVSMDCSGWLCSHWGKSSHMRNFHMTTTSRCLTQLRDRYSFGSVRKC